jgi:hypothetical protein
MQSYFKPFTQNYGNPIGGYIQVGNSETTSQGGTTVGATRSVIRETIINPNFDYCIFFNSTAVKKVQDVSVNTVVAPVKQTDYVIINDFQAPVKQTETVEVVTVDDETVYSITIDTDDTFTFTSDVDATLAEIQAGLIAALAASTLVDATASGDNLLLTAKVAGTPFNVSAYSITLDDLSTTPNVLPITYTIEIGAETFTYTTLEDDVEADVFANLLADAAGSALVDATGTASSLTLVAKTAGTPFTATYSTELTGETTIDNIAPKLYRITISAVNYDYTTVEDDTLTEILAGLQTAIAASIYVDSVNDLTKLTLTAKTAGTDFTATVSTELTGTIITTNHDGTVITQPIPTAVGFTGTEFVLVNAGVNNVYLVGYLSETIAGNTTVVLNGKESVRIKSNNSNWFII